MGKSGRCSWRWARRVLTWGVWMWGVENEGRARLGRAPLDPGGRPQGPGEPQQVSNGDRLGQSCPVHRRSRETREIAALVTGRRGHKA